MRFAFGAGGTGGHVVPALALAKELQKHGHDCIFIGNKDGIEDRLSKNEGYPFHTIRVRKLYRKLSLSNLAFPYFLAESVIHCKKILREEKIDAVIGTGGFVSGPVIIAAILCKIPCFLHESNSYPGLVTRKIASKLRRLYISFEDTRTFIKKADMKNLGIPIQEKALAKDFSLSELGLEDDRKTLLITGGSQGSLAINEALAGALDELLEEGWQILWQTGRNSYSEFSERFKGKEGLYMFDFTMQMNEMMSRADLAITRAGAITTAELERAKLPAIMIPLPTAAANHQYYNALAQEKKQAAILLPQSELTPNFLLAQIRSADLLALKHALDKLPENNAAENITQDILDTFEGE
ncbi:MAG TPA: undecaprenyldiphospho-muramoylpentapeptide beta-N-acetylglucosaminyltransferase [Candidatus Cloacimonetes bacterium]|nr:undecaprenyldiphospho-muramoylpentapeptide beta-N-acetylglucosaminyltransferase [Candidatus Cloacimonadota bacterium]